MKQAHVSQPARERALLSRRCSPLIRTGAVACGRRRARNHRDGISSSGARVTVSPESETARCARAALHPALAGLLSEPKRGLEALTCRLQGPTPAQRQQASVRRSRATCVDIRRRFRRWRPCSRNARPFARPEGIRSTLFGDAMASGPANVVGAGAQPSYTRSRGRGCSPTVSTPCSRRPLQVAPARRASRRRASTVRAASREEPTPCPGRRTRGRS